MSGPITVYDGDTVSQDPSAVRVYQFDWNADHLAVGVTIATSAFTVQAIRPSTAAALTKDDTAPLGIQAGSRTTKVKLTTAALGALYRVHNMITTSEAPPQTFQKSFYVLGEDE